LTPITQLYWIRVVMGVAAGAISAAFALLLNTPGIYAIVNCFTIALIIYLITYYIFKAYYKNKIEQQSKILSTAIAAYFFAWLPFLVLFYTTFKVVGL
jgi:uncharacterized membrane protein YjjP (DUF1212 family)